jgi:thiamine biosynthesis protein ThiI
VRVRTLYGRLLVESEEIPAPAALAQAATVFGVANLALAEEVPQDMEAIRAAAWRQVEASAAASFAVRARRADKAFPLNSQQIEREVGAYVMERAAAAGRALRVDLENPELTVHLELADRVALVSGPRRPGPGGLPVGTSGRVVALLSSGLDSPVASWSLMKRGARVVFCHFHSHPYTSRASVDNCRRLVEILTRYQYESKLYLVPFAPVQEEILSLTPAELRMILYRRSMVRMAGRVAERERAEALVTGESLGQVASQTLTNMAVIDEAAHLPVLRPLVGSDKEEIVQRARQIGTYEVSIRPYEDCCSLMVARHPATRARLQDVLDLEGQMELSPLEARAVEEAEVEFVRYPPAPAGVAR